MCRVHPEVSGCQHLVPPNEYRESVSVWGGRYVESLSAVERCFHIAASIGDGFSGTSLLLGISRGGVDVSAELYCMLKFVVKPIRCTAFVMPSRVWSLNIAKNLHTDVELTLCRYTAEGWRRRLLHPTGTARVRTLMARQHSSSKDPVLPSITPPRA